MEIDKLKPILEALFAASDKPLSVNQLFELFVGDIEQPGKDEIRQAIQQLVDKHEGGGFELKQVASGFRFQVRSDFETWVVRLWEQKPPRYSRALMETSSRPCRSATGSNRWDTRKFPAGRRCMAPPNRFSTISI
jgi:segregation and condensation protein B